MFKKLWGLNLYSVILLMINILLFSGVSCCKYWKLRTEFGNKTNRTTVIGQHKAEYNPSIVFKLLYPLKISRRFFFLIGLLIGSENLQRMKDKPRTDRPRTLRIPKVVRTVENHMQRSPLRKQKIMTTEIKNFSEFNSPTSGWAALPSKLVVRRCRVQSTIALVDLAILSFPWFFLNLA